MSYPSPAACPACGAGPLHIVARYESELLAYGAGNDPALLYLGAGQRLKAPKGEERNQVHCLGCDAHWPRFRTFERDWIAAGRPRR